MKPKGYRGSGRRVGLPAFLRNKLDKLDVALKSGKVRKPSPEEIKEYEAELLERDRNEARNRKQDK